MITRTNHKWIKLAKRWGGEVLCSMPANANSPRIPQDLWVMYPNYLSSQDSDDSSCQSQPSSPSLSSNHPDRTLSGNAHMVHITSTLFPIPHGQNKKSSLRLLDLFAGTGSVGKCFQEQGLEVNPVDFNPKYKPTICCDI